MMSFIRKTCSDEHDGSQSNGSKANTRATILLQQKPVGVYYVAPESNRYLSIMYGRILIRRC